MEISKNHLWFNSDKVAKIHTRYATVTGDQSLAAIVQNSKTETDLVGHVSMLVSTKNVKAALRLREVILLIMEDQINDDHIRMIEAAFVDPCAGDPSILLEIYCEVLEEFKLVKIDFANSYCQIIRAILNRYPGIMEHPCFSEVNVSENVMLKKVHEVESHYARVIEQERQCRSHDYWDEIKEEKTKNARLSYKKMKDGSLKVKSEFATYMNLFNFLALLNEVDLYPKWVPFCKKSKIFKDINDFSKAAVMEYNLAALFFSREMCVIAFAWDRLLHRGNCTIECKSVHQDDPEAVFNDITIPKPDSTRVEIHMMTFEIHPKQDSYVEIVALVNADPKIWFAPNMLINYIFKQVIGYFIDKILKFSQTVHEKEWGHRMAQRPEFYEFLRNLVNNYLNAISLEDPNERESLFKKKDIEIESKKKKK